MYVSCKEPSEERLTFDRVFVFDNNIFWYNTRHHSFFIFFIERWCSIQHLIQNSSLQTFPAVNNKIGCWLLFTKLHQSLVVLCPFFVIISGAMYSAVPQKEYVKVFPRVKSDVFKFVREKGSKLTCRKSLRKPEIC